MFKKKDSSESAKESGFDRLINSFVSTVNEKYKSRRTGKDETPKDVQLEQTEEKHDEIPKEPERKPIKEYEVAIITAKEDLYERYWEKRRQEQLEQQLQEELKEEQDALLKAEMGQEQSEEYDVEETDNVCMQEPEEGDMKEDDEVPPPDYDDIGYADNWGEEEIPVPIQEDVEIPEDMTGNTTQKGQNQQKQASSQKEEQEEDEKVDLFYQSLLIEDDSDTDELKNIRDTEAEIYEFATRFNEIRLVWDNGTIYLKGQYVKLDEATQTKILMAEKTLQIHYGYAGRRYVNARAVLDLDNRNIIFVKIPKEEERDSDVE